MLQLWKASSSSLLYIALEWKVQSKIYELLAKLFPHVMQTNLKSDQTSQLLFKTSTQDLTSICFIIYYYISFILVTWLQKYTYQGKFPYS